MATRGRPKKVAVEPPTSKEQEIAEALQRSCFIPGCSAKFHMEDAKLVLKIVKGES